MKHRKPNRLKGYDYSQDNLYFVTSCVHDMVCCFGVVTGRDLSIDDSVTGQVATCPQMQVLNYSQRIMAMQGQIIQGQVTITNNIGTDNTGTGHTITNNIGTDNTGTGHTITNNIGTDNTGTGHDLSLREPQMILNDYGKIAEQQWYWLAEQYPYVVLHEFTVMPNHIHGIIEIDRNAVGTGRDLSGNVNDDVVGTGRDLSG